MTDIFYIVRKERGIATVKQAVSRILAAMKTCTVDRSVLEAAIASNLPDFEDAVQLACAIFENLDAIITRDNQGFAGATFSS